VNWKNLKARKAIAMSLLFVVCSVTLGSTLSVNAQSTGTFPADIHIMADGSVTGTDKIQRNGDVYSFTNTVLGSIVVERNNLVIEGDSYILQGPSVVRGQSNGLSLYFANNITIRDLTVQGFGAGIWLLSSSNDVITNCKASISINGKSSNNIVSECVLSGQYSGQYFGLSLQGCQYNLIEHNLISGTPDGIDMNNCQNNTVTYNTISGCSYYGLFMEYSWENTLTHNNIEGNRMQVSGIGAGGNNWDANYWSDLGKNSTYLIEYGVSELTGKPSNDTDNHPATAQIANTYVTPTPTFTANPSPSLTPSFFPSPTPSPSPSPSVAEFPTWTTSPLLAAVAALAAYLAKNKKKD
jgi:parallel beta-helix repeat protein